MTSRAAEPAYDAGAWAVLSRRLSPYLDLALGLLAAGFAVFSLLSTSLASVDPRLHDADVLAVGATLVAGLSLAWRRRRPVTAFAVFVVCCLVVVLRGHYIGLLSVILLFSLYSLTVHGHRRRDGVAGLVVSLLVFVGLALLDIPDLGTADLLQACALLVAAWAVGDAIRSRRGQASERQGTRRDHSAAVAGGGWCKGAATGGVRRGVAARSRVTQGQWLRRPHRTNGPNDPVQASKSARGPPSVCRSGGASPPVVELVETTTTSAPETV